MGTPFLHPGPIPCTIHSRQTKPKLVDLSLFKEIVLDHLVPEDFPIISEMSFNDLLIYDIEYSTINLVHLKYTYALKPPVFTF